jgi:hypothetical protein
MDYNKNDGTIDFNALVLMNEESLNSGDNVEFSLEDLQPELPVKEVENLELPLVEDKKIELTVEDKKDIVNVITKDLSVLKGEGFSSIAKKMLEKGDWEDGIIEVGGKEVKLSEVEDLDEETFFAIWEEQNETSKETLKKDFISIKGADKDKLRLIEIIQSGADLKQIFANEDQMRKPYEGLDLSSTQNLQSIYYNQLLRQDINEDDAKDLVIKATKDLSLDAKANSVVNAYQKRYSDNLEKISKETSALAIKEKENAKEYKKSLHGFYKEEGLEDSLSKLLTDAGTKVDNETGQLYIDTVYEKLMEDPAKAKDLIFFMLEQEKFLAAKGVKIKTEVELGNLKRFKIIRETSKTSSTKVEDEPDKKDSSVFGDIVLE